MKNKKQILWAGILLAAILVLTGIYGIYRATAGKGDAGGKTITVQVIHSDGFVSLSNLFVESNIDVEPERAHYNALYLRGNEIVVDGEINMYVYDPGTNNANGLFAAVTGIVQKIARNYRFSTVVIGTPSSLATTVADPMPRASGGLDTVAYL